MCRWACKSSLEPCARSTPDACDPRLPSRPVTASFERMIDHDTTPPASRVTQVITFNFLLAMYLNFAMNFLSTDSSVDELHCPPQKDSNALSLRAQTPHLDRDKRMHGTPPRKSVLPNAYPDPHGEIVHRSSRLLIPNSLKIPQPSSTLCSNITQPVNDPGVQFPCVVKVP